MISILYVDDEPALLEIGKLFLERSENLMVDTAVSGAEAITKLQSRHYDGIISDYQMPEMDGIAFLKYVRTHYEYLPFVLFTGRGREEVVIEALNNGADFYIQKGGDPTSQFVELEHKVTVAINKKRTECQLEESQQRMANVVNFLPDATFAINCQGEVIIWNRSIEEMTGIKSGDILGTANYSYAIPFYGERRPVLIDLVLRDDKEIKKKYPWIVKQDDKLISENFIPRLNEGKGAYISFTAAPLYDNKGHVAGAIESIRDITELKQAQDALRSSEEQYRTVFETTGTATVLIEENTVISLANWEFERLCGYPKQEIEGKKSWTEFVVKDDLERMLAQHRLRRERQEAALRHYEFRMVTKSGDIRHIFLTIDMIPGTKKSVASLMDITERKRAEEALMKSQIQLAEAMDLANLVNWEFDVASGIFTFNDRFYALFGTTAEREGGYQMPAEVYAREFVHPDEAGVIADEVQNAITATDPNYTRHIEHRIIRRDGDIRHITVQFGITKDAEGRTVKTHGANQDITDRKRAEKAMEQKNTELHAAYEQLTATEEELRQNYDELSKKEQALQESEEKYRTIFENAGDAIAIHDLKGHFVEVNDVICRRFGYTREELLKMRVVDVDNPDHAKEVGARMGELTKKGHIIFETVHIARDGRQIPTEASAVLFHLGNKPLIMSIARDITGRRRMEDALRESGEKYRDLVELLPQTVFELDERGFIASINQTGLKTFGITQEDLERGIDVIQGFVSGDRDRVGKTIQRILSREKLGGIEFTALRKDGSMFPVIIYADAILHQNTPVGVRGVLVDITGLKHAEEELRRTQHEMAAVLKGLRGVVVEYLDPSLTILWANEVMTKEFGISPNEVRGKHCYEVIQDRNERCPDCPAYTATQIQDISEKEVTLPDGRLFLVRCNPVMDEKGSVAGIVHAMINITEHKRAEEALEQKNTELHAAYEQLTAGEEELRQSFDELSKKEQMCRASENNLKAILESLQSALVIIDPKTHTIVDANSVAIRMIGAPREEIIGHVCHKYICPAEVGKCPISDLKQTIDLSERILLTAKGEQVPILKSVTPKIISGHEFFIENLIDITDRKKTEAALLKKQQDLETACEKVTATEEELRQNYDELSKKEQALRQSEEQFHTMADFTYDWEYWQGPDKSLIYISPSCERLTGYTQQEFLADPQLLVEIVHPDDRTLVEEHNSYAWGHPETTPSVDFRIIRRDGTVRWIAHACQQITEPDGKHLGRRVSNRDITERKDAETALRESENNIKAILESLQSALVIIDPKTHTIVDANSVAIRMIGAPREEIIGHVCHKYICPAEVGKCPISDLKQTIDLSERILLTARGEQVPILKSVTPKIISGHEYFIENLIDITERKRAEEQLHDVALRWQTTFDSNQDALCLLDRDQRIVMCNRTMAEICGVKNPDELVGRNCWEIVHGTKEPIPGCPLVRMRKSLKRESMELKIGDRWFFVTTDPVLNERRMLVSSVHTIRDITERKRMEDALALASQKLNLLSGITRHDLLNQLTALRGYLELSRENVNDPVLFDFISKEEQIAGMIENLILFTRDYQDLGVNAPAWQNVNTVVGKAIKDLPLRDVRVDVDRTDPEVFADPLLDRVFYNLVDNAIRYGGEQMTWIRISSHERDTGLVIACEDDGVGISKGDKKHIFERGFGHHTGLGLFLSREILLITGIMITEAGEPGKGARFEIAVPKGMYRFAEIMEH